MKIAIAIITDTRITLRTFFFFLGARRLPIQITSIEWYFMYRKFIYLLHNPRSRTITPSLFIGLIQIFIKVLVFICCDVSSLDILDTKSHNTIMP